MKKEMLCVSLVMSLLAVTLTGCNSEASSSKPAPEQKSAINFTPDDSAVEIAEANTPEPEEPEEAIAEEVEEVEETAEPEEAAEDPTAPGYTYTPSNDYSVIPTGYVTYITNLGPTGNYLKDEFGLPRQEYFWIDNETFDCIGYLFACGAKQIELAQTAMKVHFGGVAPTAQGAAIEVNKIRPDILIEYEGYDRITVDTIQYHLVIDSMYPDHAPSDLGSEVYLYSSAPDYPPQHSPIHSYYVSTLPRLIDCALNHKDYSCPLDGTGIVHWFYDNNTNQDCPESYDKH